MVITRCASLLPIVHVIKWSPFEQTVVPESTGWCAHAGSAVPMPIANSAMTAVPTPRVFFRRPETRPKRALTPIIASHIRPETERRNPNPERNLPQGELL